jgi:hypothetical protein
LLKEVYNALGDETPIGLQFETLSKRFYPLQKEVLKKNNLIAPVYYTLNDWALGTLEYIPFKDLPIKADENWNNEVSKLMYQSRLKPIYGLENKSFENNKELVMKWKMLLQEYLSI